MITSSFDTLFFLNSCPIFDELDTMVFFMYVNLVNFWSKLLKFYNQVDINTHCTPLLTIYYIWLQLGMMISQFQWKRQWSIRSKKSSFPLWLCVLKTQIQKDGDLSSKYLTTCRENVLKMGKYNWDCYHHIFSPLFFFQRLSDFSWKSCTLKQSKICFSCK